MKTNVKKILIGILAVVLVVCMIYIVNYFATRNHGKDVYDQLQSEVKINTEIVKPTEVSETETPVVIPIDFAKLWEQNEDVCAWLNVGGTNVDYPILRNKNSEDQYDDYYLVHTIDHLDGRPGAIYMEPINSGDLTDPLTVLYGHNMHSNQTMFYELHNFGDAAFFTEHDTFTMYTPEHIYTYKIYAAVTFSDAHLMRQYGPEGNESLLNDINGSSGNFREGMEVTSEDQLLVLSTCITGQDSKRYLVVGVLDSVQ